jgi:hypothetical protein
MVGPQQISFGGDVLFFICQEHSVSEWQIIFAARERAGMCCVRGQGDMGSGPLALAGVFLFFFRIFCFLVGFFWFFY